MSQVFVLLFNARTENEGIHTLQIGDRNRVLMFEAEDDAIRFALMLEAQDFPSPAVESLDEEDIIEFCNSADYDWELIKTGQLLVPPENIAETIDWDAEGNNPPPAKTEAEESEMSQSELDRIRRQLEGLL